MRRSTRSSNNHAVDQKLFSYVNNLHLILNDDAIIIIIIIIIMILIVIIIIVMSVNSYASRDYDADNTIISMCLNKN